ncbi:MAG: alpha-galactosidase, partial [Nitrospiraceae bacterium]|nr:alpha-galactosidase [Nitrospiraceae bacterium]
MNKLETKNPFPLRLETRRHRFVNLRNMETVEGPAAVGETVEIDGWAFIEDLDSHETWVIAFDTRGSVTSNDTEEKHMRLRIRKEMDHLEIDSGIGLGTGKPQVFVHRGKGDLDDAINGFRDFLQKRVLPPLTDIDPQLSYNVWYTDDAAERLYLEDAEFAAWMGFDVFTIDASWNEGGSIVPATNDWGAGLGSYVESRVKFPHGIRYLSDRVHALGLKFGLWVDPQNVDTRRVTSGEIPESWVARIDGKDLQCDHPTLSLMTELCLGNPEVVEWLKRELSRVLGEWRVDWVKWDPSGTASYNCNRTDHGHGCEDGAKAYFRGRREIMTYLFEKFPHLNGWECIFDMEICRVNPLEGHYRNVLPAYMNRFVTGPMVGPHVWGSMEYTFGTPESEDSLPASPYYEASYMDYFFRRILCAGGLSMGNITGIVSQRLRNAPLGYNDAFKRNMLQYKQYRHL